MTCTQLFQIPLVSNLTATSSCIIKWGVRIILIQHKLFHESCHAGGVNKKIMITSEHIYFFTIKILCFLLPLFSSVTMSKYHFSPLINTCSCSLDFNSSHSSFYLAIFLAIEP